MIRYGPNHVERRLRSGERGFIGDGMSTGEILKLIREQWRLGCNHDSSDIAAR